MLVCYDKEAVSDAEHPWHILKQKYRLTKVEGKRSEWLFFECRMHPRRLAESYMALPDVTCAELDIFVGDQPALVGHWNPQVDPQKPEWYQGTNIESAAY